MFINNNLRATKGYKVVPEKEQQTVGESTYLGDLNAKGVGNQQGVVFLKTNLKKIHFELHVSICSFLAYNSALNTKCMVCAI